MRILPFEYAVRNLGRNPARLLLTVGGSALVVLLVLTATGFVNGMQAAFVTSGREANVILMGSGSEESIERSEVPMRTGGIVAASLLMALLYLGGENAQMTMNLPQAITQLFQGMMLFFLLACDVLILYRPRLKWKWAQRTTNAEAMA